jgi:hypothetical protein
LHTEAGKPVDAYLSSRQPVSLSLHHTVFFHTVAYGRTIHRSAPLSIRGRMRD